MARGRKTGGRKKGSQNKTTAEIKAAITAFIGGNIDTLQDLYDQMEPQQKAAFFEKLLKFVIPTQKDLDVNFSQLTDEQLQNLAGEILKKI